MLFFHNNHHARDISATAKKLPVIFGQVLFFAGRSHLSWPVLGIFLVGAWYFLCVAKKGNFTSEASPLCLGRAHKSLRMVGHSPREGGRARLIYLTINALHAVLGQKMRRERVFLLICGL